MGGEERVDGEDQLAQRALARDAAAAVEQVAQLPGRRRRKPSNSTRRGSMQADCASPVGSVRRRLARSRRARKDWTATACAGGGAGAELGRSGNVDPQNGDDCAAGVDQACEGLRHEDEAKRTWLRGPTCRRWAAASTMSRVASAAAPVPTAPMPTRVRTMSEPATNPRHRSPCRGRIPRRRPPSRRRSHAGAESHGGDPHPAPRSTGPNPMEGPHVTRSTAPGRRRSLQCRAHAIDGAVDGTGATLG